MADVQLGLEFDDGGAINGFAKLQQQADLTDRKMQELSGTTNDVFEGVADDVQKANKATQDNINTIGKHIAKTAESERQNRSWRDVIKGATKDVSVFGVNIGGLVDNLESKSKALKNNITNVGGLAGKFGKLKIAIAATGIGLLLIALGSLTALLQRNQKAIDFVERAMAGLGAAVDVVLDRAAALGGAVVKLFSGDFVGAANDAKAALSGVTDELRVEIGLAAQLTGELQKLEKREQLLNIQRAQGRAEIKQLNLIAEDTTRTLNERAKAAEKAGEIEKRLLTDRNKIAEGYLANQLGQLEFNEQTQKVLEEIGKTAVNSEAGLAKFDEVLGGLGLSASTFTDFEGFVAVVEDYYTGQQESVELQTTLQNKLNTIQREAATKRQQELQAERKAAEALQKEYETLISRFEQQAEAAQLDGLTDVERLGKERDLAIAEVEKFRQEITEQAAKIGKELPDSFSDDVDLLFAQIQREFEKGAKDLREGFGTIDVLPELDKGRDFESEGQDVIKSIKSGLQSKAPDLRDVFTRITQDIQETFNISDDELAFFTSQFGALGDAIAENFTGGIQTAIEQNERLIAAIDEQVQASESALDRELELKKAGLANNFQLEKNNLAELQKEREAAAAETEKLRVKQAKREIAINAAQQISEQVLGATKLLTATANLPFIGLAIGLGFLGTFISTISKLKAANQSIKLFRGGKIPLGKDDRTGTGYKIENTGIEVGGGEMVVNVEDTTEQDRHLQKINTGKYRGIDLDGLVERALASDYLGGSVASIERTQAKVVEIREVREKAKESNTASFEQAVDKSVGKHIDRLIKAQKEKPDRVPLRDGEYYEITETENMVTRRKVKVA